MKSNYITYIFSCIKTKAYIIELINYSKIVDFNKFINSNQEKKMYVE